MKSRAIINWKTTLGGVASILFGLEIVVEYLSTEPRPESTDSLAIALGLIATGLSCIAARDADKSSKDSGISV